MNGTAGGRTLRTAISQYLNMLWEPTYSGEQPLVETVDTLEDVIVQRILVKQGQTFIWQGNAQANGDMLLYWLKGRGLILNNGHEHRMFPGVLVDLPAGSCCEGTVEEDSICLALQLKHPGSTGSH